MQTRARRPCHKMINSLAIIGKPFIPGWNDPGAALRPFISDLILIVAIVAVLLTPFFTKRSNAASALVALAGVIVAMIALFFSDASAIVGLQFRGLLVSDHTAV